MNQELLRIGELAVRAGVSTRTVDYYTSLGLLTPAVRTTGNYRLYQPEDVATIGLIRQLEAHGVSLDEIATALNTRTTDVTTVFGRIDADLRLLQAAAEHAGPQSQGLLAAIGARIHSLITIAMQIPPDVPLL
ncbi:MerR-family transcriptional regulator [Alloactinosynnema sp. L-07]|uniref:helix-turn-helix domain-containing protein n=1 Tax=Alloactinosynnema sp. L-07 TaxID=1653480 RepID=UPI00065EFA5E|nr:MerR family transcriptional regulator [Alloactinosynnema sp. L-07]CRK58035.1 MerR-family transcriptional regulator [Alloactinosynnema sp. L-07]